MISTPELPLDPAALRVAGRYSEAIRRIERQAGSDTPDDVRLIAAEGARMAYYQGRFTEGLTAALVTIGPADLASARAAVAASVNALALNRGHVALARANDALLRMRMLPASRDDMIDAQIQLVHVLSHMGQRADSISSARSTLVLARRGSSERSRIRAEYALGFALVFAGEQQAIAQFLTAERLARENGGTLWHWIVFCLAMSLRDLGEISTSRSFLCQSQVALRHERAWWSIRAGEFETVRTWLRPPFPPDERPYMRVIVAALHRRRRSSKSNGRGTGMRAALAAARDFERGGLHHWRWGALWLAAADSTAPLSQRTEIADEAVSTLSEQGSTHWGFFDPDLALPWIRRLRPQSPLRERLESMRARQRSPGSEALPEGLTVLNPDAVLALIDAGLSPSEIKTLIYLIERWLGGMRMRRAALASEFGLADGTLRVRINRIRTKLGIQRTRGVEPILAWLAGRGLLAPIATSRALERLVRSS